ncbi:hypothetical protein HYX13_01075 [Candidatus Woesearchaeota archaeon]|nr:hypothetical protein [Candidatus Woesearchaeota archaeon]
MKPSFFLLIALILIPLASAANGCFLYPDSPSFCQEISKEQAQEECDFFNRCELKKVFFENQFCSYQKQCQKILCKSSCTLEFLGQCSAGAATDAEWCVPGCCQFDYFENKFCSSMPSKSRCVLEVENRDVADYRFSSSLSTSACEQSCAKGKPLSVEEETTELSQSASPSLPPSTEKLPSPESPKKIHSSSSSSFSPTRQQPTNSKTSLMMWVFFPVTLLLVFIFFLFWKHAHRRQQTLEYEISESELSGRMKIPWFFPFSSHPWIKERIEKAKKIRRHKLEHHQRDELLVESGLSPEKAKSEKPKEETFRKLQKLAKKAKPEGKSPLQMLEEMGKK